MTYNIRYCLGRDDRFDPIRIIDTIRGADIVALQEVERFWSRSDNMDQARVIADALPSHYWMFGPTIDVLKSADGGAGERVDNRRRQFGNMILSRYPILSSRNHPLPKYTDPDKLTIQRGILEATIATPIGPIRVYSTHLCHLSADQRMRQIETILDLHHRAPADGAAHSGRTPADWGEETVTPVPPPAAALLAGDFNMLPGSDEYRRLAGGAGEASSPFVDSWLRAGLDSEDGVTLYSDPDSGRGLRVDYCFVTDDLAPRVRGARVDGLALGSDHQPVVVVFDES